MTQNRYIFLPPNSLDSPTQDTSILNTAKSTSILNCKNVGVTLGVSDCEELVGVGYRRMLRLDYCFVPDELNLTKKMSSLPEFVFPSNPP